MKTPTFMILLLCLTDVLYASEAGGIQGSPRWSANGDLVVEVSNWSKLGVHVESVSATLLLDKGKPCAWKTPTPGDLGSGRKQLVTIGPAKSVSTCIAQWLDAAAAREPARVLLFEPLRAADSPSAARSNAVFTLTIRITHASRTLEAVSKWSLRQAGK